MRRGRVILCVAFPRGAINVPGMTRLRLLPLLLVLSLGLSTVGFGMARGQAPGAGQMVICTGAGIITVTVDAEGNPVESHTLCPDAALVFLAAAALEPPALLPRDLSLLRLDWPQDAQAPRVHPPLTRGARGPPA